MFGPIDESEFNSETESHHETEAHKDDKYEDTFAPDVDSTFVTQLESIYMGETSSPDKDVHPSWVQHRADTSKIISNPITSVKMRAQIRNEVRISAIFPKLNRRTSKKHFLMKIRSMLCKKSCFNLRRIKCES